MSDVPISEHALLSDCRSSALVTSAGSIDWLCLPRFDSPPVMSRLLDDAAGHFLIAPADGAARATRRYLPQTLVLETLWTSASGDLVVTDALALGRTERGHNVGHSAPGVLLRRARCSRGKIDVAVEFSPRPEFGLVHPRLEQEDGCLRSHGGATVLTLSTDTDAALQVRGANAKGTLSLLEGQVVCFALEQADAWARPSKPWRHRRIRRRLEDTERSWRSWSELHQRYDGPLRELVHHSGLVLRGLTYAPSGAIVAAATTSLPEGVGSGRTWDYRYTWVRDASLTLRGLWVAACPDEAMLFFTFLARAAGTQLDRDRPLQIMYGIGGERDLTEHTLPHLAGWRDSAPVRSGNGAWNQTQLDVYGSTLDAAYVLREQLTGMDERTRAFLVAAVDAAVERWREPDQGIWEIRGPAQHYLHSKLMCWVALDRGLRMVDLLDAADRQAGWQQTRDEIRDAILERGWSEQAGAFVQAFDGDALDASSLLMALTGILPPDDHRLASTIDAVASGLADERGLLYRYRTDDGLEGEEGTFLLCTFWLAEALAVTGQVDRAAEVLDLGAGYASDLGLLAEQVDATTGEQLGNTPQAFSHLGLVLAAQALSDARSRPATAPVRG